MRRRQSRTFLPGALAAATAAAALGALLLTAGCSGSGDNAQPATTTTTTGNPFDLGRSAHVGRVLYRFQYELTDDQMAGLTADNRAALEQNGATINGSTITLPDVPAIGHWVRIGDAKANTDSQGRFGFTDLPAGVANGSVFVQLTDTTPRTTFSVAQNVGASVSAVPDIIIVQSRPLPGEMNPGTDDAVPVDATKAAKVASCCANPPAGNATSGGPTKGRIICTKRNNSFCGPGDNSGPCCLDYNNPKGDGGAYLREKFKCPESFYNFLNSTCYNWSGGGSRYGYTIDDAKLGTACANEAAFVDGAPGCYENHKYRNCQNLDNSDFSIKAPATRVFAAETLKITVRNNTQSNESDVQMTTNPGSLSGETYFGNTLKHYKDNTRKLSNGRDTGDYYIARELTYTAPPESAFPAGAKEFPVTVTATAFGKTQSVTFIVCKCGTK